MAFSNNKTGLIQLTYNENQVHFKTVPNKYCVAVDNEFNRTQTCEVPRNPDNMSGILKDDKKL